MTLVPFVYTWRSLFVRRGATLLTIVSIGATVAVLAAVTALQQGFLTMFQERGREDLAVMLRVGAGSEGESGLSRETAELLIKESPEFTVDESGRPRASAEVYLALRLEKDGGGQTNVPVRGVQPMTYAIHRESFRIVEGRAAEPGSDEVVVGYRMAARIPDCRVGEVLMLNLTPFRIVGTFAVGGSYDSEIWGDSERMLDALERPVFNRVIGELRPDMTAAALQTRLEADRRLGVKALDERSYLAGQTRFLEALFGFLGTALAVLMGIGAVFTGINTMYSALASRTREVGILLTAGFRPFAIFVSFLTEAVLLGVLGGLVGLVLVLPLDGIQTGTTNFQTFSEVAFAFRITPTVLATGVVVALVLGVVGGALPAWRAARLEVAVALRRR